MPAFPAFRIPRRSGLHRIASIALYRALLSQCHRLQIEDAARDEVQNLIRNRFKQARRDASLAKLKISFEAGYEAIDLLDNAVAGSVESKDRILKLLDNAPLRVRQPPATRPTPAKQDLKSEGRAEDTTKPRHSLFDRPLPLAELSGKRHVPVLVNANQIPMLRIKKPQPEHLSGYLAHRVKTRGKRHDRRHRLEDELNLAEQEDRWDEILATLEKKQSYAGIAQAFNGTNEPSWCDAIEEEIDVVSRQLRDERRKNREMAEKMQDVVDRETALYEKEKAERRRQRGTKRSVSSDESEKHSS